jgi:hypothetical protein
MRELRYTSSQDAEDSFLVPKAPLHESPVRKQRVLRPVASNSRLLRKISDESLMATPDRKMRREERGSLLYAKTLAKSVARKRRGLGMGSQIDVESMMDVGSQMGAETVVDEKSIFGGGEDKENLAESEDDDDDEPVVQRRRVPRARQVVCSSAEESDEDQMVRSASEDSFANAFEEQPASQMPPPPLKSARPPHRKGHSTISNWAQEVIDLTSSPEPPETFDLPSPGRTRTTSFAASSRPTSAASNDADAMLHL